MTDRLLHLVLRGETTPVIATKLKLSERQVRRLITKLAQSIRAPKYSTLQGRARICAHHR